jgi:hypothetical protein
MTTEDIIRRIRELAGDCAELSNRVKDAPMRAQHVNRAYCARVALDDAATHLRSIADELESDDSRDSVPPILAANLKSRTEATESFRKAREILKGIRS